ncbi:MAG: thioredoxin family protein [Balneolaceae bacterium]
MAAVNSTMLDLGTKAPDFSLTDVRSGSTVSRDEAAGDNGLLVMFICNHCPYVKNMKTELADFAREYMDAGLGVAAISSNDVENYPDDSPDKMKQDAEAFDYPFPYLYDESQEVAKAYKAACTPDFFLFDADLKLAYRGQFDDSRPGNDAKPTGSDMRDAVQAMLGGDEIPEEEQKPSIGCNIKWKQGNEPDYFG